MPIRFPFVFIFAASLVVCATGCGSGGNSNGGNSGNGGTSTLFKANSADLTQNAVFGFPDATVTYKAYHGSTVGDAYTTVSYSQKTQNGVKSLQMHAIAYRADGTALTLYPVNNTTTIAEEINAGIAALYSQFTFAYGTDGWIYLTTSLPDFPPVRRWSPPTAAVGTTWVRQGYATVTDTDGTTTSHNFTINLTVLSVTATAPHAGISDCILLHEEMHDLNDVSHKWTYIAPGLGFVETTNTDPELPQTDASGSFVSHSSID